MNKDKAPAFQFYPNDWSRDLNPHSLEIRGAWITICCELWWSDSKGKGSKTVSQWARILGIPDDKAIEVLEYLKVEKIGDVKGNLTKPNARITVINRRMVRDEEKRKNNRLRQRKHYNKNKPNADLTPTSQDSSSSSSSSKEKNNKKKKDPPLTVVKNGPPENEQDEILISIPIRDGTEFGITQVDVDDYGETYPRIDIMAELRECRRWNMDNPDRRKTRRGIRRHVNLWLSNANKNPKQREGPAPDGLSPWTKEDKELLDQLGEKWSKRK